MLCHALYRNEADNCRALADEFSNRPERTFLLSAADVYECLADEFTPITKARCGAHLANEALLAALEARAAKTIRLSA